MNEFSLILLKWFHENGRDLPWRKTSDPYAIWLSEIILQQTQVKQGWDYWERFMRRWPTVDLLAAASEDEVLLNGKDWVITHVPATCILLQSRLWKWGAFLRR